MDKPKPQGGRPRRRPFTAHDARRARTYLRIASEALASVWSDLPRSEDVYKHLYLARRSDIEWAMEVMPAMVSTLGRLQRAIDCDPAPGDGQSDG